MGQLFQKQQQRTGELKKLGYELVEWALPVFGRRV